PPPPAAAPALPQPGDTNAERAKTQPGNNAPLWRAVRESGTRPGYVSLPGLEMGQLVQTFVQYPGSEYTTAGEAWRQVRNRWLIPYGGALLLIMLLAAALHYLTKGPIGVKAAPTGRMIERFTPLERAAHWVNAAAFVVLAVSGIVMAFGKFFLLPVIGSTLFGWLTFALKTLHNFVGPLFAVSLVIVIATFIKDNFPGRGDLAWLAKGGGLFNEAHVPSHRFNAGEKLLFWAGVLVLGLITVGSGLVLNQLIPQIAPTRGNMQVAHMIHGAASVLMMAMFIGHIYVGTIGVKGAYAAMRHGYVDEAWAREHHEYWHDDIQAGRIPTQRSAKSAPPADAAGARA
ncbi:MAG: formate dehydrogenase subunit gamma, partial [Burkholderiales bacterium]|nr:formate dehydrogenase subunit gamma [Burkholderiales bacterium]